MSYKHVNVSYIPFLLCQHLVFTKIRFLTGIFRLHTNITYYITIYFLPFNVHTDITIMYILGIICLNIIFNSKPYIHILLSYILFSFLWLHFVYESHISYDVIFQLPLYYIHMYLSSIVIYIFAYYNKHILLM